MRVDFRYCLEKAKELGILEKFDLVALGPKLYKHKNIVFDIRSEYTCDIRIFETEDIRLITNSYKMKREHIESIYLFGTCLESTGYEEKYEIVEGNWPEYLDGYFKRILEEIESIEIKKGR